MAIIGRLIELTMMETTSLEMLGGLQWRHSRLILDLTNVTLENFGISEHATWVLLHIVSGRMGPGLPPTGDGPAHLSEATMKLAEIVAELKAIAESNEDRAYRILGARPGPGIDLRIKPQIPLNGRWHVYGLTIAGFSFVRKFWLEQPLSNQKLAEMKKQANEWQLTYETEYPTVSLGGTDG
jgi:hypothetical protein